MPHSAAGSAVKRAIRDWRLREIRLLFLALTVAVLSVTSISFFTDRVERAIRLQGTTLLGADLVVSSSRPPGAEVKKLAASLHSAEIVEFRSVALSGDVSLLTEVKAVAGDYPLRGALETSDSLGHIGSPGPSAPAPGEAWAAPEVFYRLGLEPGSTLELGNSSFKLTRIIKLEPDAGGSVFRFAPRLMINIESLPATGLIVPASRARYKLLIAGPEADINALRKPLEKALSASETLQTVDDGRPEVSSALNRAIRFMRLASVLTIIIAGAAVALAVLSYTRRERQNIAILKTLGATRKILWRDYALRFVMLVLAASLAGSLLGFSVQFLLEQLLAGWLNIALPSASFTPLAAGLLTAMLTLAGFSLPPIVEVIRTPPMRVMRAEIGPDSPHLWFSMLSIGLAMAGFLVWQAGEWMLAGIIFAGLLGGLGLMLLIAWLITRAFRQFRVQHGAGWQLGLANIGRFRGRAALLIATLGIGIFALSLLGTVREDLISAWKNRIPDNAPNHFLINIQAANLDPLQAFLQQRGLEDSQLYPMVRGRLRAINGQPVSVENAENHEAKDSLRRELNLTTTDLLPPENRILSGRWFSSANAAKPVSAKPGLSLEADIAAGLGVTVNDTLEFDIGGRSFSAPIQSLRTVQWDTMQPNFYVIASPGSLQDYPLSYITAVRIDDEDTRFTTELVRSFPNITVLDVRAILKQIQSIVAQVSNAVEVVFAFSLLAGIIVLLAAIQTQRNERRQEIAILKTLGASQKQIKRSVATEFMVLGALAGLVGAGMALITGWLLAEQVFNLSYQASFQALVWGVFAGLLGLGGVGYAVIQQLIHTSPVRLLQEM